MLLNRYKVKTYKLNEFKVEDITIAEKILQHIKNNKIMYTRLVFITALMLNFNMTFVFASEVGVSLDATFNQLIELLKDFAKWGCLGMGLKKLVEEMLSGASFKQASIGGMQY